MNSNENPRMRVKGVPARILASYGYSVCFFPEQPKSELVPEPLELIEPDFVEWVRLYWRNRLVFFISLIAHGISLSNVYDFPMNVWRYGPIFFIPYVVTIIFVGFPMHVLQLSMGQYCQRGPLWIWECAPLFFGLGIAMSIACIVQSWHHIMYSAYALFYFSRCFNKYLPWSYCQNETIWSNDEICSPTRWFISKNSTVASLDYFYRIVLNTPHITIPQSFYLGSLKWSLVAALAFSWVFIYVATLRGPRSYGKLSVLIVIYCYCAVVALLLVALQNNNYGEIFFRQRNNFLYSMQMWCSALIQVMSELGICYGIPIMYGSYCRFRNKIVIASVIKCVTSFLHSFFFLYLFSSYIKYFVCDFDHSAWHLPDTTKAIVYVVYSEAIAYLSGSCFWCIVFFLMLFLLIQGTIMAYMETMMTAVYDNFPHLSPYRWVYNIPICVVFFLLGLIFCCSNGFFLIISFSYIPLFFTTIPLSCLFTFGITFLYGFSHYSKDIEEMLHYKPGRGTRVYLYCLTIYFVIMTICLLFLVHSSSFTGDIVLPPAEAIMGILACIVILIVIFPWMAFWTSRSFLKKTKPTLSTNAWKRLEAAKREKSGQFTAEYRDAYTWEWNSYGRLRHQTFLI